MVEAITAMSVTAIIRLVITAASAGLTAALVYYPNQYWIPAAVAALAAIGTHVVPSVTQNTPPSNWHYPGVYTSPSYMGGPIDPPPPEQPVNPYMGEK
jgi:hypothetical protein